MVMPFLPNEDDATYTDQAEPDSIDFEILLAGHQDTGVVSGCAVTDSVTPAQTIDVAVGVVRVAGRQVTVAADTGVAVTAADVTNPRIDLVTSNLSGVIVVTAGTPAAQPVLPAIPATSVPLATLYVPANDNVHGDAQINDKRVFVPAATVFNAMDYGATGDGTTDDTTNIDLAITALEAAGKGTLYFPDGTFNHTGLTVASTSDVTVRGEAGAVLHNTSGTTPGLLLSSCTDVTVVGLTFTGLTAVRDSVSHGVRLNGCTRFVIDRISSYNQEATGILIDSSTDGVIRGCTIRDTLADGIHMTNVSKRITVVGNTTTDTGDDAIAVVSYQADAASCTDISIIGNTLFHSKSRGVTIIGDDCSVTGNIITACKNAGIHVTYDSTFTTYGASGITVTNNVIDAANTYDSPSVTQAGIQVNSSSASFPVDNVLIFGNVVTASGYRMIGIGDGTAGTSNVTVLGNQCFGNVADIGIDCNVVDNVTVDDNYIYQAAWGGISINTGATGVVSVSGNKIVDCNTLSGAFKRGINVEGDAGDILTIINNLVHDPSDRLSESIQAASQTKSLVAGNVNVGTTGADQLGAFTDYVIGGRSGGAVEEASNFTLDWLDGVVNVTTASARVVTLPDNAAQSGKSYMIRREGANTVTINRAGADTFSDASTSKVLATDGAAIGIFSIGDTEWKIVGTQGTVT